MREDYVSYMQGKTFIGIKTSPSAYLIGVPTLETHIDVNMHGDKKLGYFAPSIAGPRAHTSRGEKLPFLFTHLLISSPLPPTIEFFLLKLSLYESN